jgi:hypothetical protein
VTRVDKLAKIDNATLLPYFLFRLASILPKETGCLGDAFERKLTQILNTNFEYPITRLK